VQFHILKQKYARFLGGSSEFIENIFILKGDIVYLSTFELVGIYKILINSDKNFIFPKKIPSC
jgi:hypothetical protein